MNAILRIALYQPDIPQNAGTLVRLGACMGVPLDVIEPCGFLWDDKRMRRAGMDYVAQAEVRRHVSWNVFRQAMADENRRVILLTTKATERLDGFSFRTGDVIMVGRESAGVPDAVAAQVDRAVLIPMRTGVRSLNVALAATLAVGEALRQLGGFPGKEGA